MTREQRLKHLKKVEMVPVSNVGDESEDKSIYASSFDISCLTTHFGLPVTALQAISTKAKELLDAE